MTSVDHDRSITLKLRKHLVARGRVTSDLEACVATLPVLVQRRTPGSGWTKAGRVTTNANGGFRVEVADTEARYRATVAERIIGGTDVCLAPTSSRVRHVH